MNKPLNTTLGDLILSNTNNMQKLAYYILYCGLLSNEVFSSTMTMYAYKRMQHKMRLCPVNSGFLEMQICSYRGTTRVHQHMHEEMCKTSIYKLVEGNKIAQIENENKM